MNNSIAQTNFEASRMVYREYDDYLAIKKATSAYLRLEEEIIINQIAQLSKNNRQLAIDLGCGTGRIALLINEYFNQLICFDISDEMLSIAKEKFQYKKPKFIQHDFNFGIDNFIECNSQLNLICASFGVGSCIENLNKFLINAIKILNEDGLVILSFYNKNYNAITSNTNELPFSSFLNTKENKVFFSHKSGSIPINIQSYTHHELETILSTLNFSKKEFYFLPTLSGLIRSHWLHNQDFIEKILEIDRSLLHYKNTVSAPYILLVLRK